MRASVLPGLVEGGGERPAGLRSGRLREEAGPDPVVLQGEPSGRTRQHRGSPGADRQPVRNVCFPRLSRRSRRSFLLLLWRLGAPGLTATCLLLTPPRCQQARLQGALQRVRTHEAGGRAVSRNRRSDPSSSSCLWFCGAPSSSSILVF